MRRSSTSSTAILFLAACYVGCNGVQTPTVTSSNAADGNLDTTSVPGTEQQILDVPRIAGQIDNLDAPIVDILRGLPGVAAVTASTTEETPSHRVVHLLDWHFVPQDDYAIDIRGNADEPLTDEEVDASYDDFLKEVEAAQQEQMEILRCLIRHHGLRRVCQEGLRERDLPIYRAKVDVLRNLGRRLPELREQAGDDQEARRLLGELEGQHRHDLLQIGAAGRLLISGEIEEVLPLDDAELHEASNPVKNGSVVLDDALIEARENGQVREALKHGPVAVLILGGAHDLGDNVPKGCQYIRVTTKQWKEIGWD